MGDRYLRLSRARPFVVFSLDQWVIFACFFILKKKERKKKEEVEQGNFIMVGAKVEEETWWGVDVFG